MGQRNSKNKTFKQFPDVPSSYGMEYMGKGQVQIDFFKNNSNSYDLIDKVIKNDDEDSFYIWAQGYFMDGQQYDDFDKMNDKLKGVTYCLDQYLDQGMLTEGITVCRGSTGELLLGAGNKSLSLAQAQSMQGQIVSSKSMLSTGAAAEGLPIATDGRGSQVEYRINIPANQRGVGMWIGDTRINGWGAAQREFLTSRDSMFRVGKSYNRGKTVVVELDWIGQGNHDYGKGGINAARNNYLSVK